MFTVMLKDKSYSWNKMCFQFDTLSRAMSFAESMFNHYSKENKNEIVVEITMEPIVYDWVEDDIPGEEE